MATPQNNAYDVVYTLGAAPTEPLASDVKPLATQIPQVTQVTDLISRALKGSQQNAQQYVDAVTANAGAEAAKIAGDAVRRQRSGNSGFADLATVIQQGVQIAQDTRLKSEMARNEEERRLAEEEKNRQRDAATVELEIEQQALQTQAEEMLRSPEGEAGYTRRVQSLTERYRDRVSAEAMVRVTGELFAPMQRYTRELVAATRGTIQQEADIKRSIANRQFTVQYAGRFEQLAQAGTPEEQQRITNEIIASIGTDTTSMSPFDRAQAIDGLLTTLGESYALSTGRMVTASSTLRDIQGYSTGMAAALAQYEQDNNLSAFLLNEAQVYAQYPMTPATARYTSPTRDLEHALDVSNLQGNSRDAQAELLLTEGESIQLGLDTVTDLAYKLFSDPASLPLYEGVLGRNPEFRQAQAVAQLLRDQQTTNADANAKIQQHQLTIQSLNTSNVQQVLSWANSQNDAQRQQYDQTITNLLSIPGLAADVRTQAEAYLAARATNQPFPPEQIAQLNQAVIASREQSIALVQSQIRAEVSRIEQAAALLRPYGLDTPEGVQQQIANAADNLNKLGTTIAERRRAAAQQQGRVTVPGTRSNTVQPNFEMPRLQTATVGDLTAPLPFAEGTSAPLTGGDGLYMQYRQYYNGGQGGHHQGLDVATAVGTPLIMYAAGKVTYVGEAGDYGNLVEIETDDGYVHRFAHLDSYTVKIGDRVNAGQVFGRTGGEPGARGAGSSRGPHLHWEVRVPSRRAGGGETMNPLEYTTGLARTAARRPRNGQEVSQPGMQLGNGQTLSNSSNGGYTTSNPLQQRFASTRAADYQRSRDGSANFGYAALTEDRPFRIALHRAAQELNMPAQWLADVMAFETGGTFASSVVNMAGSGATGLIQFMPDTLAAYGYTPEQAAAMTNVQQMELVVEYLDDVRKEAGLSAWRSPFDVLMAVWGGGSNLRRFIDDPESVRNLGDGSITWKQYTERLGSNAGRRYRPVYDAPVQHTSFVQGCPTCVALLDNGNQLYAHVTAAGDVVG